MTYKVKKKTRKKRLPKGYFKEKELRLVREKYKGKVPVGVIIKEGIRVSTILKVPKKTHKKGNLIKFKGKMYSVQKVSRQGVHLAPVKRDKKNFLKVDVKKTKFVPEKKYSGKAMAYYPLIT